MPVLSSINLWGVKLMKRIMLALMLSLAVSTAQAQTIASVQGVPVPETLSKQATVVEASNGDVLYAKDAQERMPTSSMSKVLTMYLVFEAIKNGKFALDTELTISEAAWKQPGSRMFLDIGQKAKVEDLVRGVIIQSGNDAAVALAEAVAGSEGSFAGMMNDKARELGLANSHFMNATGLPDAEHYSTARDLATLAISLIRDFPEYYHYYSETEFTYNKIKQGNRNPLLYRNMGADGVKTGHTEDAGYGLIGSVLRDGRRVVTVVNGLKSMQERADQAANLLEWAYREFASYAVASSKQPVGEAKVWLGSVKTVAVVPEKDVMMTLPRSQRDVITKDATVNTETEAPIHKGQKLGNMIVAGPDGKTIEVSLVATQDVPRLGFFPRLVARLNRMIGRGD